MKTPEKSTETPKNLENLEKSPEIVDLYNPGKKFSNKATQLSQTDPGPKKINEVDIAGLVSNFSKEMTKIIQQNTHLKTIIQSLEEEISKHNLDTDERKKLEKLENENLVLITSHKEKDAYIRNMERKLEDTVEKLQYANDQLDVATLDLNDNHPQRKRLIDTKEKHLKEKTELLNTYKEALDKSRKETDQLKKEVHHLSRTSINHKLLQVAISENVDLNKEIDIERNKVLQLNDKRKSDAARIDELLKINQTLKNKIKDDSDEYETISNDSHDENPPKRKDDKNKSSNKNQDNSNTKPDNAPPYQRRDAGNRQTVCRFYLERRCRYGNSCWYDHPQDQRRPSSHGYDQMQRQRYNSRYNQTYHPERTNHHRYRSNSVYSSVPKQLSQTQIPNQQMQTYSQSPKQPHNQPPNQQMQPQMENHPSSLMSNKPESPSHSPQTIRQSQPSENIHQGPPTTQTSQQMLNQNHHVLLNQIPLQMLAQQPPFQFLSHQLPLQMYGQYPNQMLVSQSAVIPEMVQQHLKNTSARTLENSNLRSSLPEVNNLQTINHPEMPVNTNQV